MLIHSPLYEALYIEEAEIEDMKDGKDLRLKVSESDRSNVIEKIGETKSHFISAARNLSRLINIAGDEDIGGGASSWVLSEAAFYADELLTMAQDLEFVENSLTKHKEGEQ